MRPATPASGRQQPGVYPKDSELVFTFETGIVPILFLVAAKCRDPKIRRAAVRLLATDDERHENLWKAKCFARIASRFVGIETDSGEKLRRRDPQPPFPPALTEDFSYHFAYASDTAIGSRCAHQETASCDAEFDVPPPHLLAPIGLRRSFTLHDSHSLLTVVVSTTVAMGIAIRCKQ
jgi:hypothetical protein